MRPPDPGQLSFGAPPVTAGFDAGGNWHIPGGPEGGRFARRGTLGWSAAKAAALRLARGALAEALARDRPDGLSLRLTADAPAGLARRLGAAEGAVHAVWRDAEHALVRDRDGRPVAVPWRLLEPGDGPDFGAANDLPDVFSTDDAVGDCYPTAIHVAQELEAAGEANVRVVHGTVLYQGADPRVPDGAHITHAWVEYDARPELPADAPPQFERLRGVTIPVVVDRSNGNDVTAPRQLFYGIGQVENPRRYTVEEAQIAMLVHGHYGPWPDTPERGASNDLVTAPDRTIADYVTPGVVRWARKLAEQREMDHLDRVRREVALADYDRDPTNPATLRAVWADAAGRNTSRRWMEQALLDPTPDPDAIETLRQAHLAAVDELGSAPARFSRSSDADGPFDVNDFGLEFAMRRHGEEVMFEPDTRITSWFRTDGPFADQADQSSFGANRWEQNFDASQVIANVGDNDTLGEYLIAEDPTVVERLMVGQFPAVRTGPEVSVVNDLPGEREPITVADRMLNRQATLDDEATVARALSDMFDGMDLPLGVRTHADPDEHRAMPARRQQELPLSHGWSVSGEFLSPDGEEIGSFSRIFYADRSLGTVTVEHDKLHLEDEWRGQGIGPQFVAKSIDAYRAAGFHRLVTHGASTVDGAFTDGAYTWARAGWEWDLTTTQNRSVFLRSAEPVAQALEALARHNDLGEDPAPITDAAERLRALIAEVRFGRTERPGTKPTDIRPIDIANLGRGRSIGKAVLNPATNPYAPKMNGRDRSLDFAYQIDLTPKTRGLFAAGPEVGASNDMLAPPGRFGWVPGPPFPVTDVEQVEVPSELTGTPITSIRGKIADPGHPVIGYRGVSDPAEIRGAYAALKGGWRSTGTARAAGEHGTAFSATPADLFGDQAVWSWGGDYRDARYVAQVAVDLRGLPFESIAKLDDTGTAIDASRKLGVAITGDVPFGDILAVRQLKPSAVAELDALYALRRPAIEAVQDEAVREKGWPSYREYLDTPMWNIPEDRKVNLGPGSVWKERSSAAAAAVDARMQAVLDDESNWDEHVGSAAVIEWLRGAPAEVGVSNDMPDQPGFRVRDVPRSMRGSGPRHEKWLKGLKVGDAVIHVHGDWAATGTVATIDEATPRYVKIGGARFERDSGDQHGSFGFLLEPTPDVIGKLGELGAEQGAFNDLPPSYPRMSEADAERSAFGVPGPGWTPDSYDPDFEERRLHAARPAMLAARDAVLSRPAVVFNGDDIISIIDTGRLLTQHETGVSGGAYDPDYRRGNERNVMGVPDDFAAESRPVHGLVPTPGALFEAEMYGDSVIFLKPDRVADRTTFTIGDSLDTNAVPIWPDEVDTASERRLAAAVSNESQDNPRRYIEVQVHGGVTLDDIAAIAINEDASIHRADEIQALLDSEGHDIKVFPIRDLPDAATYRPAEVGAGNDLPPDASEGERKLVSALLHYQQGASWGQAVYGELGAAVRAVVEGRPVPQTNPDRALGYVGGQEKLEADAHAIVDGLARYSTPVDGTLWRGSAVPVVDPRTPEQRAVPSQDIQYTDGAWRYPDGTPVPSLTAGDPPKVGDTFDAGMLSFTKDRRTAETIAAVGVATPDENSAAARPPAEQIVYRLDNAVGYPLPNYAGEQEVVAAGTFTVTAVDRDADGRWVATLSQTPPPAPPGAMLDALADEPVVARIVDRYEQAGHPVYIVGGAVRDALAGKPPNDIDLTSPATPEQTSELLDPIGAVYPLGIEHGTVVVNTDGQDYEVTTHRTERYDPGSRQPITEFTDDLQADLARRDFTVNAMAYNPATRELIDPFGGQADLDAGVIRAVGDPRERFSEDPLRIIRAVRFAAVNGWDIDPDTEAAARRTADRLDIVSVERIGAELDKVLKSKRPTALTDAWAIAQRLGIGDRMFGPLAPAFDRPVPKGWTPLNDVPPAYRLAALVHAADIDPGVLISQMKRGRDEMRNVANILTAARRIQGGDPAGALRRYPDDVIVAVEALTTYAKPMLAGHWVNRQRLRAPLPVDGNDLTALGLTGREVGAALARIERAFLANGGYLTRDEALAIAAERVPT